jgi:hypothetical protein
MKRKTKIVLHLCSALLLATPATHAALLAYEGFDYSEPIGTLIGPFMNGGTGWLTAFPEATTVQNIMLGDNLSYPGMTSVGKGLDFNGGNGDFRPGRDWECTYSPPADGTYWYSLLTRQDVAGRGTLMIFKSTVSLSGQDGFGFVIDNNGGSPQFKARTPTQSAGVPLDFTNGYGATYFVLGRLDVRSGLGNYTTNTIWVYKDSENTGLPTVEPVSGGSTITSLWDEIPATGYAQALRTALSGRGFSNNTGLNYDEIRIGQSFADVTTGGSVPSLTLTVQLMGNNVVVSWAPPSSGTVKLLSGSTLGTITNEVVGATSPYTNAPSAAAKFFRTRWVPPTGGTGTYTKLQVLLPGETAAPGTPTGKTGTPTPLKVGDTFYITVNAVDNEWYPIKGINNYVELTSTDPSIVINGASAPQQVSLCNGTVVIRDSAPPFLANSSFGTAGSRTITATDGGKTGTSSAVTVNP